jgi:hypothetical protein
MVRAGLHSEQSKSVASLKASAHKLHEQREKFRLSKPLEVVLIRPSKYRADGYVERFHKGYMPNSTMPNIRSLTQEILGASSRILRPLTNMFTLMPPTCLIWLPTGARTN